MKQKRAEISECSVLYRYKDAPDKSALGTSNRPSQYIHITGYETQRKIKPDEIFADFIGSVSTYIVLCLMTYKVLNLISFKVQRDNQGKWVSWTVNESHAVTSVLTWSSFRWVCLYLLKCIFDESHGTSLCPRPHRVNVPDLNFDCKCYDPWRITGKWTGKTWM